MVAPRGLKYHKKDENAMAEKKETPQARWDKENTRVYRLKVMRNTESDILDKLESESNVSGYIKRLIREDIAKQK